MQLNIYTQALLLGVFATLGFAPFNFTVLLIISFALIYIILNDARLTIKQSFLIGLWFGLAHFSTSFYWFGFALATDIYKFGWLIPFAIFGLSLFFSFYFSLAFLIFKLIKFKNPILFSIIITFFEFLRANLFTGFPWNLIGYTWDSLEILQFASLFGIYGLTFLTIFLSGSIGALMLKNTNKNLIYCTISLVILLIIYFYGTLRLQSNGSEYSDIKVRVVQANISHQAEWTEDYAHSVINTYIGLTISPGIDDVNYVIWPESSIPFGLSKDSVHFSQSLSQVIPKILIVAGNRIDGDKIFNSIFIIKDGKIIDYYDKVKLVPFGEYVPSIIPIKKIVNGVSNFNSGCKDLKVIESLRMIPTICYEDIFTKMSHRRSNADWIINLTNDSWFGLSSAPYQHLQMARARAIEYGMPLVRSTTTGISAVFDGYGRIIKKIDLNEKSIIDVYLPKKLKNKTLYSNIRNFI